jgi:hypothetical protein
MVRHYTNLAQAATGIALNAYSDEINAWFTTVPKVSAPVWHLRRACLFGSCFLHSLDEREAKFQVIHGPIKGFFVGILFSIVTCTRTGSGGLVSRKAVA